MHLLSRPRRPHRFGEWTSDRAVTFIVTLAASRNVTLAARAAGMSRKSAYALRGRDSVFAAAWNAALSARREGDEVDEVDDPRFLSIRGNRRAADERLRDAFFARLAQSCSTRGAGLD